jgi:hypothetical protein
MPIGGDVPEKARMLNPVLIPESSDPPGCLKALSDSINCRSAQLSAISHKFLSPRLRESSRDSIDRRSGQYSNIGRSTIVEARGFDASERKELMGNSTRALMYRSKRNFRELARESTMHEPSNYHAQSYTGAHTS